MYNVSFNYNFNINSNTMTTSKYVKHKQYCSSMKYSNFLFLFFLFQPRERSIKHFSYEHNRKFYTNKDKMMSSKKFDYRILLI